MLTPLQERLAGIIRSLPEADGFALAGAGGLIVHGLIERVTRDLDYFAGPGEAASVGALRDALESALDEAGLGHRRVRDLEGFVRIEITDGNDHCEVDLAVDSRVLPLEQSALGPTLAVRELAANKVLALFDRAEPRDFLDLAELSRRFDLGSLLELAAEKDTGFDRFRLLESLGSFSRFSEADFGLSSASYRRLQLDVDRLRRTVAQDLGHEFPGPGL